MKSRSEKIDYAVAGRRERLRRSGCVRVTVDDQWVFVWLLFVVSGQVVDL